MSIGIERELRQVRKRGDEAGRSEAKGKLERQENADKSRWRREGDLTRGALLDSAVQSYSVSVSQAQSI